MKDKIQLQLVKRWKAFCENKILSVINICAIVLALIVITMTASFVYLKYGATPPASNARLFYSLRAEDQKGNWSSFTVEDCKAIDESVDSGFTWFNGRAFGLLSLSRDNRKEDFRIRTTNSGFWRALDFNFTFGKPYSEKQYDDRESVAVISEKLAKAYFGELDVVGRTLIYGSAKLRVLGVYKPITVMHDFAADIYVPHSLMNSQNNKVNAFFYAEETNGESDLNVFVNKYNSDNKRIFSYRPFITSIFSGDDDYMYLGLILVAFLLPIFSFASLFSRRMETRLSEMAIRRAYGATRKKIFFSLVTDNILSVVIAGFAAIILARPLIGLAFNPSGTGTLSTDFLSLHFYLITIFLFSLFGVFSAIRPAWRVAGKSLITTINS